MAPHPWKNSNLGTTTATAAAAAATATATTTTTTTTTSTTTCRHNTINGKDVQRKNVVNNVDKSSLWEP